MSETERNDGVHVLSRVPQITPTEPTIPAKMLRSRRDAIAKRWYEAIAPTNFIPLSQADTRRRITDWTDRASALLLDESLDLRGAQTIGQELAGFRYLQSDALDRTLTVLGQQLVANLPAEHTAVLQPRLAALLGALGGGFFVEARRAILAEQERTHAALLTGHTEIKAALRQNEGRYCGIFEHSALGIALFDAQGRLIEMNPALPAILGYSANELRNAAWLSLTHSDDLEKTAQLYEAVAAAKLDHYQIEKRYLRKNGEVVWARLTVSLVRDAREKTLFVIALIEDVTARTQAEDERAETYGRLAESREAERLALARELHDGPVQDLIGAQLRLSTYKTAATETIDQTLLQTIEDDVQSVVDTLRAITNELRPPALAPFGLASAIRSHVGRLQLANPTIEIRIDVALDEGRLPETACLALFRIYQIAMSNVVRHAKANHVWIQFKIAVDQAILELVDDGCGFVVPEGWLGLARQGHFGLLGAEERAKAIGGRLEVISVFGHGTIVRVVAPCTNEKPCANTSAASAQLIDDQAGEQSRTTERRGETP